MNLELYNLASALMLPLTVWIIVWVRSTRLKIDAVEARLDSAILRLTTLENSSKPKPQLGPNLPQGIKSSPQATIDKPSPAPRHQSPPKPNIPKPIISTTLKTAAPEPPPLKRPKPIAEQPTSKPAFNWEQFMGVRMFAWLGGLALFLAAAFFVKYSFDHGLISPELRVTIGFLVGGAALAGGIRLDRNVYRVTADTLCAAGVVILYAITFAGHAVYSFPLFSAPVTFGSMILITIVAFLLSVRFSAQVIAILGMLGGFLTPLLLTSNGESTAALFTYIAVLDVGLMTVAFRKRWNWLTLSSAVGTFIMQWIWILSQSSPRAVVETVPVFLGFCALYVIAVAKAHRSRQLNPWLSYGALIPAFSTLLYVLLHLAPSTLGGRPSLLYVFLISADLCVLAISLWWTRLSKVPPFANALVFLILALWTAGPAGEQFLLWVLAGYVGFGILHAGLPLLIQARRPDTQVPLIGSLLPIISLFFLIPPLVKGSSLAVAIIPAMFVMNLVAITTALLTASAVGILLALIATSIAVLVWILSLNGGDLSLPTVLPTLGGLGLVFTLAPLFLRQFAEQIRRRHPLQVTGPSWLQLPQHLETQLPALSLVPPFLLLSLLILNHPIDSPWPVFGTSLGLGALGLFMHRRVRLTMLPLVGLGGTVLVEAAWHGARLQPGNGGSTLTWYLGSYLLFFLYPFTTMKGTGTQRWVWITGAVAGIVHFLPVYDLWRHLWPNPTMGLLPLGFAVPPFVALYSLSKRIPREDPNRRALLAWFAGCGLLFITLIFPIQFQHEWLTVAWCLEGAALVWLFRRLPAKGLLYTGLALLAVVFVRLCLNPAVLGYHPRATFPLLNWYSYTYGIAIVSFWLGARLMPPQTTVAGTLLRPLYYAMSGITAFVLLNIEIADFYSQPGQSVLRFAFGQNLASDMTYTIAWGLYALMIMIVGIRIRNRATRYAGIGLLAATLLKLFVYDMASLTQLYRVGAFVGIAVIAMVASLLYQKFLGTDGTPINGDIQTKGPEVSSPSPTDPHTMNSEK